MVARCDCNVCQSEPCTHETDHCDNDACPECCGRQPLVFGRRGDGDRSKTGDEADEKGKPEQEEQLHCREGEVRALHKRQEPGWLVRRWRRPGGRGEDDCHQLYNDGSEPQYAGPADHSPATQRLITPMIDLQGRASGPARVYA